MKRILALILACVLSICGISCSTQSGGNTKKEIVVFAAASLTESLSEIADIYERENPGTVIKFNFESSGTLKTQIEQGAECDIFISAGQKQMNQLDKLGKTLDKTRFDLLENKVVLCISDKSKLKIKSFSALAISINRGEILMAMGNSDVPVGQYTSKILSFFNLDEKALAAKGNISYASNTKEVTSLISESAVDCGVIYHTDAKSANLTPVDFATADMCGKVVYPAAIIKSTDDPDGSKAFMKYLSSDPAVKIFEKIGFSMV